MGEISLDDLRRLADQISLKDLERIAKMEQAQREARQGKTPLSAEASGADTSDLADLRRAAMGSDGEGLLRLDGLQGLTKPAGRRIAVVNQATWVQARELEKLRKLTDVPAEEEEEEKRRRITPRDVWKSIYAGVLGIALYPERAYRATKKAWHDFTQLPGVVRGVMLIAFALVLLTGATYTVGIVVKSYLRAHQGPFLEEALVPPHDLNLRPIPSAHVEAQSLLPATLGQYQRTTLPITTDSPSSPTNQCLLGLGYARDVVNPPYCRRTYGATSLAAAKYRYGYLSADVAIARFPDDSQAGRTMEELLAHARAYGRVGNFVIGGLGEVDFFYSSVRGWVSLTWSHGPWVYSISTMKFDNLEDLVGAFPY